MAIELAGKLRRAVLIASAERYINLLIGFVLIAAVSRLLSPAEIGASILGATVIALVEMVRDVPSTYLLQRQDLTPQAGRAAFSIMLAVSAVAAAVLLAYSKAIGTYYGDRGMTHYAWVLAAALMLGPFERPASALMRRNLDFTRLAAVNICNVATNAVVAVGLVACGVGYMSFAWATLAASLASVVMANSLNPVAWIYRPQLAGWREPVRLGAYSSAWGLLRKGMEVVPYLVLGQQLNSLGLYSRATTLSETPDKLILAGIGPVAYPALAAERNAGRSLQQPLLMALGYITAVAWPAYLLLAMLANPAVNLLLGPGWVEVVPVLQILALAKLLMFFDGLIFAVLFLVGALRSLVFSALLPLVLFALTAFAAGGGGGPTGVAICLLVVAPVYCTAGLICLRRAVPFAWRDLAVLLARSAGVTLLGIGPPALLLASGWVRPDMGLPTACGVIVLAGCGWLLGLALTRHPLRAEVMHLATTLRRHAAAPRRRLCDSRSP